jgi:VIT1/CCC1 family predicted Fe2+/Mn2+ transporter
MYNRSKRLKEHLAKEHNLSPLSAYLKEIVYGGTDGIVTTFAVVAGFAGAQTSLSGVLPVFTVLLFGFANLFADGVSMALGSFLSAKSEKDVFLHEEEKEKKEVKEHPVLEVEETVDILVNKGFTLEQANQLAEIYKTNESYWIEFMMKEEIGFSDHDGDRAGSIAVATFVSFIFFGLLPLLPYVVYAGSPNAFVYSVITTATALILLGVLRYRVTRQSFVRAVSESLLLGGLAASVAYIVGTLFNA